MSDTNHDTITDELRRYATAHCHSWLREKLLAIADRIDAAHERECKEQYAYGAEHGIGVSIEASMIHDCGFIELPKGADGEYIHEGDKVEWRSHDGVWQEAATVAAVCGDGCYLNLGLVIHVSKFDIRHYHAPTVEDVLREFGDWYAHTKGGCDEDGVIADFAAKLRLAGDDAE